jgi:hypothetical protein
MGQSTSWFLSLSLSLSLTHTLVVFSLLLVWMWAHADGYKGILVRLQVEFEMGVWYLLFALVVSGLVLLFFSG